MASDGTCYRNHRGQVLVVLSSLLSGYMTWVSEGRGSYQGYGFWAPTREEAQKLLDEAAARLGWEVVDGE